MPTSSPVAPIGPLRVSRTSSGRAATTRVRVTERHRIDRPAIARRIRGLKTRGRGTQSPDKINGRLNQGEKMVWLEFTTQGRPRGSTEMRTPPPSMRCQPDPVQRWMP